MKSFEFLADRLPFGYAYNFDNYLFNKVAHINLQGIAERADFFIINNVKRRIEAKIHFLLKDGIAFSPYKSLFGSFEFSSRIHPNLLLEFWTFIENDLRSRNVHSLKITNFANCYAPGKAEIVLKTMERSKVEVSMKAVNHHIKINEQPLAHRMHPMEVRRLNKCRKEGFSFSQEPRHHAKEIYDYLNACRKERRLQLSVSKEMFLKYLEKFPQNYPFFSVRKGDQLMAATIAIKVHKKILYNFLPGSLREFKRYSPTVLLNKGLYDYGQNHRYEILDLGISTEQDGKHQRSLIDFKERIGGEKSYKYFFEKRL